MFPANDDPIEIIFIQGTNFRDRHQKAIEVIKDLGLEEKVFFSPYLTDYIQIEKLVKDPKKIYEHEANDKAKIKNSEPFSEEAITAKLANTGNKILFLEFHGSHKKIGSHVIKTVSENRKNSKENWTNTLEFLQELLPEGSSVPVVFSSCYSSSLIVEIANLEAKEREKLLGSMPMLYVDDSDNQYTYTRNMTDLIENVVQFNNDYFEFFLRELTNSSDADKQYSLPSILTTDGVLDGSVLHSYVRSDNFEGLKAKALTNLGEEEYLKKLSPELIEKISKTINMISLDVNPLGHMAFGREIALISLLAKDASERYIPLENYAKPNTIQNPEFVRSLFHSEQNLRFKHMGEDILLSYIDFVNNYPFPEDANKHREISKAVINILKSDIPVAEKKAVFDKVLANPENIKYFKNYDDNVPVLNILAFTPAALDFNSDKADEARKLVQYFIEKDLPAPSVKDLVLNDLYCNKEENKSFIDFRVEIVARLINKGAEVPESIASPNNSKFKELLEEKYKELFPDDKKLTEVLNKTQLKNESRDKLEGLAKAIKGKEILILDKDYKTLELDEIKENIKKIVPEYSGEIYLEDNSLKISDMYNNTIEVNIHNILSVEVKKEIKAKHEDDENFSEDEFKEVQAKFKNSGVTIEEGCPFDLPKGQIYISITIGGNANCIAVPRTDNSNENPAPDAEQKSANTGGKGR